MIFGNSNTIFVMLFMLVFPFLLFIYRSYSIFCIMPIPIIVLHFSVILELDLALNKCFILNYYIIFDIHLTLKCYTITLNNAQKNKLKLTNSNFYITFISENVQIMLIEKELRMIYVRLRHFNIYTT